MSDMAALLWFWASVASLWIELCLLYFLRLQERRFDTAYVGLLEMADALPLVSLEL